MLLVACAAWWATRPATTPSLEERQQQWQQNFSQSFEAIRQGDFDKAERHLGEARALAADFPAGDRSLAETYDDMGLLYYKTQRIEDCKRAQASAITALLLAGGPDDPELSLYIDRLAYVSEDVAKLRAMPARFFELKLYPVRGQRLQAEAKKLIETYRARHDEESARIVEVYLASAPTS